MGGVVRATTVQNEAGSITIPTRYFSSRIIQRTAYTHRIGWWRGNNTYYWVPGAYIDFRPMRDDTRIKVSFMIPTRDYGSVHMISHWIFYRDDIEYGRHTRGGHHVENAFTQEWDLESWGAGQYARVGYKFRAYAEGNHNAHLYHARYWDGAGSSLNMPGQVIVEEYIPPNDGTTVEVFRSTGTTTWTAPEGVTAVDVLVVGGGGGGGMDMGGGGGAGGVRYQTNYPVTPGANYTVTVGRGGYGAPAASGGFRGDGVGPQPAAHNFTVPATSGLDSRFGLLVSQGGGHGGTSYYTSPLGGTPGDGGSGGGRGGYSNDNTVRAGGLGIAGQGNNGGQGGPAYYSGGGGGAGGAGAGSSSQPNGGPGVANSIMGRTYYFGGGGAGSGYSIEGGLGGIGGGGGGAIGPNKTGGIGGLNPGGNGGGGARNAQSNRPGGGGGNNTGGGGGGGSHYSSNNDGGNGGSGIVVIRYRPAASALE